MKWLPIILAVVFFKLTVLPSCESSTCCSSESTYLTDSEAPVEDNDCASSCMCLHCGYTTVVLHQSQLVDQTQDGISAMIPIYKESYKHHYSTSLWHPPLMG